MSKYVTPLALTLALAFAAAAHADAAKPNGDFYREAIWDIHAAEQPASGSTGAAVAGSLYDEAVWDIHAAFDDAALAKRFTETQSAGRPAGRSFDRVFQAE